MKPVAITWTNMLPSALKPVETVPVGIGVRFRCSVVRCGMSFIRAAVRVAGAAVAAAAHDVASVAPATASAPGLRRSRFSFRGWLWGKDWGAGPLASPGTR